MSTYKEQLSQKLFLQHWEIVEINASGLWWDDEYWVIRAIKENWDLVKGKFAPKLNHFISRINNYRKTQNQSRH